MNPAVPKRRFKINPVELVILGVVLAGFGASLFSLFQEKERFEFTALQQMKSSPTAAVRVIAPPAATTPSERKPATVDLPCKKTGYELIERDCMKTAVPEVAPEKK